MVSGGLSVGYGIRETAIKEAAEEASIPESLAQKIVSAGCVSFFFESERGLFPNTEYVYDLELPLDFIPNNADGEVKQKQKQICIFVLKKLLFSILGSGLWTAARRRMLRKSFFAGL